VTTLGVPNEHGEGCSIGVRSKSGLHAAVIPHPLNANMSASIRDRLIALALYRLVSAPTEADEVHPQRYSDANPISLLERLYRLRLVSAGIPWRNG
jgi:hypothetical protein